MRNLLVAGFLSLAMATPALSAKPKPAACQPLATVLASVKMITDVGGRLSVLAGDDADRAMAIIGQNANLPPRSFAGASVMIIFGKEKAVVFIAEREKVCVVIPLPAKVAAGLERAALGDPA